ncbi:MAG: hypothetical protein ABL890_00500 [Candidatus Peribacteraceae bacterium]
MTLDHTDKAGTKAPESGAVHTAVEFDRRKFQVMTVPQKLKFWADILGIPQDSATGIIINGEHTSQEEWEAKYVLFCIMAKLFERSQYDLSVFRILWGERGKMIDLLGRPEIDGLAMSQLIEMQGTKQHREILGLLVPERWRQKE